MGRSLSRSEKEKQEEHGSMASNLIAIASNLEAMTSNLRGMASNLIAMTFDKNKNGASFTMGPGHSHEAHREDISIQFANDNMTPDGS